MAFGSVTLVPGVNVERTPTLLRAGIAVSSLIRFRDSLVQKLGGWLKLYPFVVTGVPRDLHAWQDLNGNENLSIATTGSGTELVVIANGNRQNITPQTLISNFAPAANISTTISSPTVSITDPNIANVTINDSIFFNTPVSIGGLILDGLYPIAQITGTHSYNITAINPITGAPQNATATASNATVPVFTATSGSPVVEVTFANNGLVQGNHISLLIPTVVGGITLLGDYAVAAVLNSNDFTIQAAASATSSAVVPMNGGDVQLLYYITLGPPPAGTGFGLGGFGLGGFGTGVSTGTAQTGLSIMAVDWTTDNWGEILVACPEGGAIYYWDPTGGFTNAAVISTGPALNAGIFVSAGEQILVALGSSVRLDLGYQRQPLLVQWSDAGNFNQWTPNVNNQAGNYPIPNGSRLVAGTAVPNQNLLWTDQDAWAMNYIGPPDVFGFTKIGAGLGAVSSHAIQQSRGSVFWMAPNNFASYTSNGANVIPCPVWDAVFQNINTNFIQNVRAMPNSPFNEVGWLYPSAASTSGECDSYVKMNITEPGAPWDYGPMNRSAWIDQSVLGNPIGASPQGIIYQHEVSPDAAGSPLVATFTTGFFYLAESEEYVFIDQVILDFKWSTFAGGASAQIQITFNVVNFPGDTPISYGPYLVTQATEYISTRFRGRMMSITVTSSDIGSFWRLGSCKYRYAPAGRR